MRAFYERVFGVESTGDDSYCEIVLGADWRLALCALEAIDFAAPGAHTPASNRAMRIEVPVDDVDLEFPRLSEFVSEWVTPPTDWPWGTRAAWLRDPDGNLISLYRASGRA
jgi:predicted enzyme related to lactoylglutathione lyase